MKSKRGTGLVTLPIAVLGGMILGIVILVVLLYSTHHREDLALRVLKTGSFNDLLPSIVGLAQSTISEGNKVEVIQNGAFFPLLLRDIAAAKETIHFEMYVWWKGDICRQVATALAAKAKEGLEVRVLLDASGSSRMDDELFEMMEKAGVKAAKFHPPSIRKLGRMNNRDHRKIVVLDGRIGYIGGHGIAEQWTGDAQDKKHWRDTMVRVEGLVVRNLQEAFCENWIEQTGEVTAGEKYFPRLTASGTTRAHVAYTKPSGTVASVQLLYYLAISAAQKELIIQNPYFLPDDDAMLALEEAVKRGVDVKVMVPGTDVSDSALVQHASHHKFGHLLQKGIKIYEYKKTLLHQKVMIVDGLWSAVGSTNFDARSFEINDEISMGIVDPGIAAQLKAAFEEDMKSAEQVQPDSWSNRPIIHKVKDAFFYWAGSEQL